MIQHLYILQNDTHPQTHVQKAESIPEADSENYPFNGLLPRVQGECALRSIIVNLLSIHHSQRQQPSPPQVMKLQRSWVQLTGLLWRPTTQPTHQTRLDGGGAEALAKSDLKFPESLRRGDQIHIPSGNPTALWYCELTRE